LRDAIFERLTQFVVWADGHSYEESNRRARLVDALDLADRIPKQTPPPKIEVTNTGVESN
jgi:hypothetical protein